MSDTNEKRETVADIIAEMRQMKRYAKSESNDCRYVAYWCYQTFADRLEAALKRELSKNVSKNGADFGQLGDAAKLREALSDACYAMFNFLKLQTGGYEEMASALDKAKAALAAPARNCDRFGGDYKILHAAWFDWTGSPSGQNADGTVKLTFDEWLLAPAKEREGGSDGN